MVFTLDSLQLAVGVTGFGLSITGGSIKIASLAPTTGDLARRWTAVQATGVGGTISVGGAFSATVSGLQININSSSLGAGAVSFTTLAGISTADGTTEVKGQLTSVNIANVVSGSAGFSVTKSNVSFSAGGAASERARCRLHARQPRARGRRLRASASRSRAARSPSPRWRRPRAIWRGAGPRSRRPA